MCFCVFPSRCVISSSFCVTHPAPHSSGSQTFRSLRTCTSSSILLLGRQSASIFSCISMGRGPISIRSAVRLCQRNAMFCFFIEYFTSSVVPSLRRESAVRLSMIFSSKRHKTIALNGIAKTSIKRTTASKSIGFKSRSYISICSLIALFGARRTAVHYTSDKHENSSPSSFLP